MIPPIKSRLAVLFTMIILTTALILGVAYWSAPSADTASQTLLVSTDTELAQAIAQSQPGTMILLKPGTYRPFTVTNKSGLTIQAEKLREYEAGRKPYEIGNIALLPHIRGTEQTKDVVLVEGGSDLTFRGLHISVAQRNGLLTVHSRDVLVESSVIHDVARTNGQGILFDSTRDATAKDNVIYDIRGSRAHAIYAAGSDSDNARFIGNRGFDIDGAVYQLNAEDRQGDRVISGAVVANNIAQDGPFGGNFCGVANSQFSNNLGFRLDKGFTFYAGNGLCAQPSNNKLYHNTLVTRAGDPLTIQDGKNYDIRNNIFVGGTTKGVDGVMNHLSTIADVFQSSDGQQYLDYRLKEGVAVIDRGILLAEISTDLIGGERVVGARPDFGAFEFGASVDEPIDDGGASNDGDEPVTTLPTTVRVSEGGLILTGQAKQVALSWRAYKKSDLQYYVVSRKDEGMETFRRVANLSPQQLDYADATVQPGKKYQYKIRITTQNRSLTGRIRTQIRDWIEPVTITLPHGN